MRVALVTSEGRCGIAEHSAMLMHYSEAADPSLQYWANPKWLDPLGALPDWAATPPDLTVLNFHRALHSRWTPDRVAQIQGPKVVVFHDTYEVQPDRLPWELLEVCDAMVVHEPCDLSGDPQALSKREGGTVQDLHNIPKVRYWRQGVPEPLGYVGYRNPDALDRPIVGTCGFAFPWKGFELLCDAAASVGWGVAIFSHNATDAQEAGWKARNPWVYVNRQYVSTEMMIANLVGCDATAFLYGAQNSGTSGAIRLGIAAGKPLLATEGCRQFRDLYEDGLGKSRIRWTAPTVEDVARRLSYDFNERFDPGIVHLRERDSWRHLGKKYADLYASVVTP